MKKKVKLLDLIMLIILISSFGVFLYPFIQNELNTFLDQKVINHYQEQASKDNEKKIKKYQEENKKIAKAKNAPGLSSFNEAVDNPKKTKDYSLDYYKLHTIGVLYIPSIKVKLPIFDSTNDVLLKRGSSLLEGSSFPAKGENIHSVISAHRGLPEAKLFSDLPKMKIGDNFFIDINNERIAYEVIETSVVKPSDTEALTIQEGKNLVTLLTCTPYMINSHRLLVTGKEVPYIPKKHEKKIDTISSWEKYRFLFVILSVIALLIITTLLLFLWYRRKVTSQRFYQLNLKLIDSKGNPLKEQVIRLKAKSNKKQDIVLKSDSKGQVRVKKISGGTYSLSLKGRYHNAEPIKLTIKRLKDTRFHLSVKNKQKKYYVSIEPKNSLTIVRFKKNKQ